MRRPAEGKKRAKIRSKIPPLSCSRRRDIRSCVCFKKGYERKETKGKEHKIEAGVNDRKKKLDKVRSKK
ncbi:hypothetical protein NDU88_005214 [Pleurodeles waltl]|uniref:Uncharacterized protein n=1 Tax=Pleurodeles waltl TaxID=8319 RepID=A0AAV7WY12_PLEWA|nr:hypothetical protein NDU88_005214 [Pleurodeles waltl]